MKSLVALVGPLGVGLTLLLEFHRAGVDDEHCFSLLAVLLPLFAAWFGLRSTLRGTGRVLFGVELRMAICCVFVALVVFLYGEQLAFDGDRGFIECVLLSGMACAVAVYRGPLPPGEVRVEAYGKSRPGRTERLFRLMLRRLTQREICQHLRFICPGEQLDQQIASESLEGAAFEAVGLLERRELVQKFLVRLGESLPTLSSEIESLLKDYGE